METIVNRIKKLLALGERGGTEAEADTAMQKVHELLAKHNLSFDEVKGGIEKEEDYIQEQENGKSGQPWQRLIYDAVAKLYFCGYYSIKRKGETIHIITGKPSNIAVVKYMAAYLIRTGEELAKEASRDSDAKAAFNNSFKKGYSYRLYFRVKEEIAKAKAGKMMDSTTGTALILHPLYDQSKRDLDKYYVDAGLKFRTATMRSSASNSDGYHAGRNAADSVSLTANGVGYKPQRQIA